MNGNLVWMGVYFGVKLFCHTGFAMITAKEIRPLHPDYFKLSKPLEKGFAKLPESIVGSNQLGVLILDGGMITFKNKIFCKMDMV